MYDRQRTIDDGRWTMPGVWHKLPTGELKSNHIHMKLQKHLNFHDKFDLEGQDQGH